jgi:fatty acid desaturase/predicted heme/steroid binding protein
MTCADPAMKPDGLGVARTVGLAAIVVASSTCALRLVPWWAFLPLCIAVYELVAALYDRHVFGLGRVVKRPSPPAAFAKPDRVFTWQELAEHNSEESAWIAVDGKVYDITEFVERHPGGRELLLLAVGREATELVSSYHPFTDAPRTVLKKYLIGSLATFEHPVFRPDTGFYREAAGAVKAHLAARKLDAKDPWRAVARMAPVYVVFAAAYAVGYCARDVWWPTRVLAAMLLGCCQGLPLVGWMHDASHGSIGHSERWWWNVGRFSLDYVSGSSMLSWRNQHVLGHHVYTNVMGSDPDLPTLRDGDPRRLVPEQVWHAIYKYQHLYLPPLYGILAFKSRFGDVMDVFPHRRNGPIRVNPISVQDYLRMASSKFVWFFYRVVVPLTFFRGAMGRREFVVLFFLTEFMTGYWLAFNFQVSHVSDGVEFLFADASKRESDNKFPGMVVEDEWALKQVTTSLDYGHRQVIATYLSGALNYQSVHHLFPSVSQYLYPEITPVVMEVARKYGVEFNVLPDFPSAFAAHLRHLKKLGAEGKPAEFKLD